MRSMTGFGQGTEESERVRVSVTLRSVNHRYLDLILRLRDEFRDIEPALRNLLSNHLERGRVEVVLEVEMLGAPRVEMVLNEDLAEMLYQAQRSLVDRGWIKEGLSFSDLARLPDVIRIQPQEDTGWTKEDHEVLLGAAAQALEQLVTARETEGEKLRESFLPRLDSLKDLVKSLESRRAAVAGEAMENLRRRIDEALEGHLSGTLSEDRLAQEAAHLIDRNDVSEELDRLASHLEHFRTIMDADGSVGKRLDFLTQEIFRELNTLGSKCRDSEMVRQVLDGKVLCEQIREQVQNVE